MKSLALRGLIFHELGLVHNTRDTKRTGESLVELPPTNIIDTLESEFRDAVGNINLCEQIPLRFETRMNQYKFSTVSLPSSHSGSSAASNASSLSSSLSSSSSSPFTSPSLSSSLASSSSTITNQVPLMSSSSSLLTIEEPLLDTDLDVELDIKPTVMNEMLNLPRTSTDTIQKHWLRLHSLDTNDKRAAVRKGLLMMSYAAVDLISRAGKKAINVSLLLRTAPTCQPNIFLQRGDNVCSAGPTEICAHCWGALAEFHQISITEYDAIRKLIRKVMESIPCSPPSMPLEDPQPTPQDRVIPMPTLPSSTAVDPDKLVRIDDVPQILKSLGPYPQCSHSSGGAVERKAHRPFRNKDGARRKQPSKIPVYIDTKCEYRPDVTFPETAKGSASFNPRSAKPRKAGMGTRVTRSINALENLIQVIILQ